MKFQETQWNLWKGTVEKKEEINLILMYLKENPSLSGVLEIAP